ncbi:MAG TPA: HAD-IA family hydrolase [Thermoleophilia bacterium]|nr:HAD-IA family hydrolase [Thermoleophilia bacterium]
MQRRSRFDAVLFDLWGTLVAPGVAERDVVGTEMARDLGVDPTAFLRRLIDSHGERFLGLTGGLRETIAGLAAACGGRPSAAQLDRAAKRRLAMTRQLLAPGAGTLRVLDRLRAAGLRLALVTDSSIETPTVWPGCPLADRFDATVFSCLTGVRKPAPEMYLCAARAVGVAPERCLFVGDGDSHELSGAVAVAMRAVRLHDAGETVATQHVGDAEFSGPVIDSLDELLRPPWSLAGASLQPRSPERAAPPVRQERP